MVRIYNGEFLRARGGFLAAGEQRARGRKKEREANGSGGRIPERGKFLEREGVLEFREAPERGFFWRVFLELRLILQGASWILREEERKRRDSGGA